MRKVSQLRIFKLGKQRDKMKIQKVFFLSAISKLIPKGVYTGECTHGRVFFTSAPYLA